MASGTNGVSNGYNTNTSLAFDYPLELEKDFTVKPGGYFVFVLKDPNAGRHEFSTSLEDHNYAKFMYLKKS